MLNLRNLTLLFLGSTLLIAHPVQHAPHLSHVLACAFKRGRVNRSNWLLRRRKGHLTWHAGHHRKAKWHLLARDRAERLLMDLKALTLGSDTLHMEALARDRSPRNMLMLMLMVVMMLILGTLLWLYARICLTVGLG